MVRIRRFAFPVVLAGAALVSAACGTGGAYGGGSGRPPASTAPAGSPAQGASTTIAAASSPLGQLIVDGSGRTLYLFEADTSAASTCYGACAQAWPPLLTTGSPTADPSVNGGDLGTSTRRDGAVQVSYHGHPLYSFVGDNKPGDRSGQGLDAFGGRWYVVGADGVEISTT